MTYDSIGAFGITASILFFLLVFVAKDATLERQEKIYYVCALLIANLGLLAEFAFSFFISNGSNNIASLLQLTAFVCLFLQIALQNMIFVLLSHALEFSPKRRQSVLTWSIILPALFTIFSSPNIHFPFFCSSNTTLGIVTQDYTCVYAVFFFISPVLFFLETLFAQRESLSRLSMDFFSILPFFIIIVFIYFTQQSMLIWLALSFLMAFSYLLTVKTYGEKDILTATNNRRGANVYFSWLQTIKRRVSYTIIYIDIDFFKQINDTFGHHEGDLVLKKTAEVFSKALTISDFFARIGGDEFLIIKRGEINAELFVRSIRNDLALSVLRDKKSYVIQFSYGATIYAPDDKRDFVEVLIDADALLYENKKNNLRS